MEELQKEIDELKAKNIELEERLKKYTNGDNHMRYYEKNKDKIKEQGTTYLKLSNQTYLILKVANLQFQMLKKNTVILKS